MFGTLAWREAPDRSPAGWKSPPPHGRPRHRPGDRFPPGGGPHGEVVWASSPGPVRPPGFPPRAAAC